MDSDDERYIRLSRLTKSGLLLKYRSSKTPIVVGALSIAALGAKKIAVVCDLNSLAGRWANADWLRRDAAGP
ncbi:MAG TPA: hypothetical protein PKH39_04995 [Woeseiaceae bacterium]|nr:hypothetical protein [Woeseiaceae bacterium]